MGRGPQPISVRGADSAVRGRRQRNPVGAGQCRCFGSFPGPGLGPGPGPPWTIEITRFSRVGLTAILVQGWSRERSGTNRHPLTRAGIRPLFLATPRRFVHVCRMVTGVDLILFAVRSVDRPRPYVIHRIRRRCIRAFRSCVHPLQKKIVLAKSPVFKKCGCRGPLLDADGRAKVDASGEPVPRRVGSGCPQLRTGSRCGPKHVSWHF